MDLLFIKMNRQLLIFLLLASLTCLAAQPLLSINVVSYPVTARVSWPAIQGVDGYYVYLNGVKHVVAGGTVTNLTVAGLTGPCSLSAAYQCYTLGYPGLMSGDAMASTSVRTLQLTCNTNIFTLQKSTDLLSWISSTNMTITNDGKLGFYRAIEPWP